tara:strand:- start:435 stop:2102 length:1668 start_codon:yes stop_codon:yes gene_type:complete
MEKKLKYNFSNYAFYNYFILLGSVFSGILISLAALGSGIQLLSIISFIPLNLNLERYHEKKFRPFWKKALIFFSSCWITGIIATSIGCYWITNSIHVFGHIPWLVSLIITGLGYGLEVGIQLFVYFGIPLLIIKKLNNWDLPIRFLYVLALDPWYPKLIQWNYGGLTFSEFPYIEQIADLIGSSGLIIFSLGLTFLTIGWIRFLERRIINYKNLIKTSVAYFLLWSLGFSYGVWRFQSLENNNSDFYTKTPKLDVLLIQPNFSLKELASNPQLSFSDREYNLETLLMDSKKGLEKLPRKTDYKKLLVWPESVFPEPFFKFKKSREKVIAFAKKHKIQILFTSTDWENTKNGQKFYGVSILVDENGEIIGRYNKIFLIPFGEMIPFSSWFPNIASWLRKNISNMSAFDPGKEYKVFSLIGGEKFSAPICFDIFAPIVIREMVRNGSNLVINLSNLAWFGRTNASNNMISVLRWRAIENRVPIVFASNNGQSIFIGANGKNLTRKLGLFEDGILFSRISLKKHFSFYREYAEWVWGTNIFLFLMCFYQVHRKGKIFK